MPDGCIAIMYFHTYKPICLWKPIMHTFRVDPFLICSPSSSKVKGSIIIKSHIYFSWLPQNSACGQQFTLPFHFHDRSLLYHFTSMTRHEWMYGFQFCHQSWNDSKSWNILQLILHNSSYLTQICISVIYLHPFYWSCHVITIKVSIILLSM